MDGFQSQVLARLPLADGVLSLLSWVLEPAFLDEVFAEHRGRSYEDTLTFPNMVSLIQDALLEHQGSGHQAMVHADELAVSMQAAYGKLRRVPVSLSVGFLARATDRLRQVFPQAARQTLPASLRALDVFAVDGKKIKRAAKRLKAARKFAGTPLGGKALAALDLRRGMVVAINAHLDGETNDAPLIPDLLPQVRERSTRRRLWIADRQFCDLVQPHRFAQDNDAYLIRFHPKNSFVRDAERPVREGVDEQGRRFLEEWGWMGAATNKQRLYVRRIHLFRDGEEDVILITNLLQAEEHPATDLLQVYLLRWSIERVFQQVTEVFHLQQLISSTPQGTIFQFAFCVLLYNLVHVVRAYIASAQRRAAETISSEKLFYDVHRELTALSTLLDQLAISRHFEPAASAQQLQAHLEQLFADVWEDRWIKSPKKKIPKSTTAKIPIAGGHTSIYRILQAAKQLNE
jgi:hypothetical protein